ncbi:MAG: hypothetical protein ACXABK_06540 [Candidatus Heimdallarchaeaceae archaeon]|jgi:hypothetical protein
MGEESTLNMNITINSSSSFGNEVYVELNRSILNDNEILSSEDEIYIDLHFDVANNLVNPSCGDPVTDWYNDEPNQYGVYSATRFCGDLNFYLDDMDLGIYYLEYTNIGNPMKINLELQPGWHYLTVIAAEYVSDTSHSYFHWDWAYDQVAFYIAEEDISKLPELKILKNKCNYNAVPKNHDELSSSFEWTFIEIQPHTEIPLSINQNQQLYRANEEAYVEVHYNVSK